MTEQAISAPIPLDREGGLSSGIYRALLWNLYQIASIAGFALIAASAPVWPPSSPALMFAFGLLLLPQLAVSWNLVRVGAAPPSLSLWALTLIAFAGAFAFVQWPATRALEANIAIVAAAFFAFVPPYLALLLSRERWLNKETRKWTVQAINLAAVSHIFTVAVLYVASKYSGTLVPGTWGVLSLLTFVIVQPTIAGLAQALADERLPVRPGAKPELKHISGLGAISLIAFVSTIVGLGLWAATRAHGAFISQDAGIVVIVGLGMSFLLVAIAPNIKASDDFVHSLRESPLVKAVGGIVSTADGVLVFSVAGAIGASQERLTLRYTLLIGHLAAATLLGWWLPAPLGLFPIFWAFVATMSVARRWAWVEEDREDAMLNRQFEGAHIKVGFDQDLRDEALLGFASLLILVPLFLRQMHEAFNGHVFVISPGTNPDSFLPWLTFFGTELAKAVPFVDWAEVYQVRGQAPIRVDELHIGMAQHVIFATRVLVDLVLLATLVQAISVAQRASKLRDMFYGEDRTLNRLDPFVEIKAFRKLVTGERGAWKLVNPIPDPFLSYDEDRLEALRFKYAEDAVGFAAEEILRNQSPELLLVEETKLPKPNVQRMEDYLERAQDRSNEEISVADLRAARYILNEKGKYYGVREQIATVIATHRHAKNAVSTLCDIVMLPGSKDTRANVRASALNGLFVPALEGDHSAQVTIAYAAEHDQAVWVRELAGRWIADHPEWKPQNGTPNPA